MTEDKPFSSMRITPEQEKVLHSALRIRILRALNPEPMTAKQVADALGGSKGNIHYHIQRLYDVGLIDLVETREIGGILEKYYKAKAAIYTGSSGVPWIRNDDKVLQRVGTRLHLTPDQLEQLNAEVIALFTRWEEATVRSASATEAEPDADGTDEADSREYAIEVVLSQEDGDD